MYLQLDSETSHSLSMLERSLQESRSNAGFAYADATAQDDASASAACDAIDQLATSDVTSDLLWDNHNFEQACQDVSELVTQAQQIDDDPVSTADELLASAAALKEECARAALDDLSTCVLAKDTTGNDVTFFPLNAQTEGSDWPY